MFEEPTAPATPQRPPGRRRRRVPSARRFAAGALASFVAVFGVLALRVHDGDDPALGNVAKTTSTSTDSSSSTDSSVSSSGDGSGSVSSTPGASTSAS